MKLIEKLKWDHERHYVTYKVVGYYASYQDAKEALNNVHTLDDVGANYNAKRLLLGHASSNVTDGVYTHKSLRQLRKAIEMLK